MMSPLAYQRAFYLARGVQHETDGLEERLLSDYFTHERLLRLYEHRMLTLSLRSTAVPELANKLMEVEQLYTQLLFPEINFKKKSFVKRAEKVMKKFEDKIFSFRKHEDEHLSGEITDINILKKELEDAGS